MVVGELGVVSAEQERHLKRIETTPCWQKAALLGTAYYLEQIYWRKKFFMSYPQILDHISVNVRNSLKFTCVSL